MNRRIAPDRAGRGAGGVADRRCRAWWSGSATGANRTTVVAYFANSNGIFVGDEVRILGVPVGEIDQDRAAARTRQDHLLLRRQVQGARRTSTPSILSPSLVTARAIQLTPAYTSGAVMRPTRSFRWIVPRCRWNTTNSASSCRNSADIAAAHPARRGQHARSVRQHRRRQPARPGRQHPGHDHQAVRRRSRRSVITATTSSAP